MFPPAFLSRAGEESPLCLSSFLLPPSLSPRSSTSLTRRTTNRDRSSPKLNCHSKILPVKSLLPDAKPFKTEIPKRRGLSGHQPTCLCRTASVWSQLQQRSASGRGPTGGGQRHWRLRRKRQRQKHAHHWQKFTRAHFRVIVSRQIWMPTNQIRVISAHARVSRELGARALQALQVYKESPLAYPAIRVRVRVSLGLV